MTNNPQAFPSKERPIIFNAEMVRAILEGRKTQTRRIVKVQPEGEQFSTYEWADNLANASGVCWKNSPTQKEISEKGERLKGRLFPFRKINGVRYAIRCPFGQPGDRLWVRETWAQDPMEQGKGDWVGYPATTSKDELADCRIRPSIHMPRWASRITLEITNVRVERIQDINEKPSEYLREGFEDDSGHLACQFAWEKFQETWNSIYPRSWERNDWVWVVEFKMLEARNMEGENG